MSKKKMEEKRKKQQSLKLIYVAICAVIFVAILIFFAYAYYNSKPTNTNTKLWSIDTSGRLNFTDRGKVEATVGTVENGNNYTLEEVDYKSFGDDVYALLRKPTNVTKPPVVIVLPAATITKEADHPMAEALCSMGYASLTLDERGNGGETGGDFEGNWTAGFDAYIKGGDPVQYKQVYDVLKGLDYVRSRGDLDGNNVAILGESIGGMWAIVAAGEDSHFKGVITISSSDFSRPQTDDAAALRFINSVMPSNFLETLPPRKLAMFQFDKDNIVPMSDGKALYDKAFEPRAWHLYNGTTHGLYDKTYAADLQSELKGMLGR